MKTTLKLLLGSAALYLMAGTSAQAAELVIAPVIGGPAPGYYAPQPYPGPAYVAPYPSYYDPYHHRDWRYWHDHGGYDHRGYDHNHWDHHDHWDHR